MAFIPFALEEWQSLYEQSVEINLADSGVHPVTLRELVELGLPLDALLDLPLHYPEVNGTRQLRERIAALYEGISANQVLVTVGAAEANAIAVETLLDESDAVVLMTPSYAQVEGIARNRGCEVVTFPLDPAAGWRPDLDALDAAAGPHVRLIAITNPNNPTGYVLSEAEMQRVVAIAEASGAWLLVDEVYRGSERLGDEETPTFVGRYERVVSINSLSKSYGLSGLRLGWIVAPAVAVENLWRRHEYATIAASAPSMLLAEHALEPGIRAALLRRNRGIVRASYDQLAAWVDRNADLVSVVPPQATALAFVRVLSGEPSTDVAQRIRREASVLVAPGACFGLDDHLRITHGLAPERLGEALERIAAVLRGDQPRSAPSTSSASSGRQMSRSGSQLDSAL